MLIKSSTFIYILQKIRFCLYLQVKRIEEEHNVFAFVVLKRDFFKLSIDNGLTFKAGSWVSNSSSEGSCGGGQMALEGPGCDCAANSLEIHNILSCINCIGRLYAKF